MKTILVTGAQGFIGRHCLPLLHDKGYQVVPVFSRDCNLFDKKEVSVLLHKTHPTHLLHLAWVTKPGEFWTSPENKQWLDASIHLFETFKHCGGERIVAAGTCAEYDWSNGICSEDTTALDPTTLYGKAKNQLREHLEQMGLSWGWGRIFHLYGPGEHPKKLVAGLIQALLQGQKYPTTSGEQLRDFLHVFDVAGALVALLDSNVEGALNIGSGAALKIKEFCLAIGEKLHMKEKIIFGQRPISAAEPLKIVADVKRLNHELQWMPRIDLDTGLDQTIQWWKSAMQAGAMTL